MTPLKWFFICFLYPPKNIFIFVPLLQNVLYFYTPFRSDSIENSAKNMLEQFARDNKLEQYFGYDEQWDKRASGQR